MPSRDASGASSGGGTPSRLARQGTAEGLKRGFLVQVKLPCHLPLFCWHIPANSPQFPGTSHICRHLPAICPPAISPPSPAMSSPPPARRPSSPRSPRDLPAISRAQAEQQPLSKLADQMCAALQRAGKAAASIWQVRHHLQLYAHSAAEAVRHAHVLIEASPPCGADSLAVDELSAYEWLRRAGLEAHAKAFEDNGCERARSLYGLPETTLKDEIGVKDKGERKRLTALLNADEASARTLLGFTSPDYARLRAAFLATFAGATTDAAAGGGASVSEAAAENAVLSAKDAVLSEPALEAHAATFAKSLADGAGHGLISLLQLESFLLAAKPEGAAAAAARAKAELLEHVRPPPKPPPQVVEPTEWVHTWLKELGLGDLAPKLLEANFKVKADLQLEPRLSLEELQKLGVEKAADARKLLNLIKKL